jgi:hypothetical protein
MAAALKSAPTPKPAPKPTPKPVAKTATPTPKAKPTTGATVAKTDNPTKSKAGDSVDISKEAGASDPSGKAEDAKQTNAYEGVADKTSEVTVDPYKKGKNDTIEGILRNQGYSLQDIYNKDKGGKTLIDHVASVNKLKNPNVIQDGAKLKIPGRDNSESLSSMDLKPGESQDSKVENKKVGVGTESTMEKKKDGSSELGVKTNNEKNPDAELSTKTEVGKDGRIDTNSTATKEGVETNTVAQNKDGSAVTQEKQTATEDQTKVTIKDIDKRGDNTKVTADNNTVTAVNPGSKTAGDVKSTVDISEKSSDGTFENAGRWVAEKFGYGGQEVAPVTADKVGQVDVTKNSEGQATVSTVQGGKRNELLKTAGDTDDTWVERAGESVDEGIDYVGDKISDGAEAVADTAASAWNELKNWWNGTDNKVPAKPDAVTSKSAVHK